MLGAILIAGAGVCNSPLPSGVAHATTPTTWYVNGDPSSGSSNSNDCTEPSPISGQANTGPCRTIQAKDGTGNGGALSKAASGDTIVIAGSDTSTGGSFTGVYCEQLSINSSVTLQAQDATNPPTLDGGAGTGGCTPNGGTTAETSGHPVITVNGGTVTLQSLTIEHGDASSGGSSGGGIYVRGGTANVTNSTITNNTGCSTSNCVGSGGGIGNIGTIHLTDSTVSGNVACTTSTCQGQGGGIFTKGTLTVTGSTISGNTGCGVGSNPCNSIGGGIDGPGGTVTLNNSTVSGNAACSGGSTSGTTCSGNGGGIANGSTLTLINATISGNHGCLPSGSGCTGVGGGIRSTSGATTALSNSILGGNDDTSGSPDCFGTVSDAEPNESTVVGDNLIRDGTGCTVSNSSGTDMVGTSSAPIEPKLGPLQANGGPTQTMALLPGSPAIHAGDLTTCDNAPVSGVDQRGEPRPASGSSVSCDIGAYDTVGNPTVYVSPSGNDANTCAVSSAPCQHIRVGLATVSSSGTVNIAGRTYCEQVVVDQTVTLQGASSGSTATIDGGAGSGGCTPVGSSTAETPGHSVMTVGDASSTTITVTLQNLTIQHGNASGSTSAGGGIYVYAGATLNLTNSTVSDNAACRGSSNPCQGFGGGIDNAGTTTLTGTTVSGNVACSGLACSGSGGGLYSTGTTTMTNSAIHGNISCSGANCTSSGGGISIGSGTTTLINTTVSANSSCNPGDNGGGCDDGSGGGIDNASTLTLSGSTVSGNDACNNGRTPCSGGGIYNAGTATLANSTVSGNIACTTNSCSTGESFGGGITNTTSGTLTLTNSTVSANTGCELNGCTSGGGGIDNAGTLTLTNSTLTGNAGCTHPTKCTGMGGGIYSASGSTTLVNATVSGNNACNGGSCTGTGGGVDNAGGAIALSNSMLVGNGGTTGSPLSPNCSGTLSDATPNGTISVGDNIIQDATGCTFTPGTGDMVGTSATPIDPKLDPSGLQNNGGPTQTVALLPGSPAIGTGDSTTCGLSQIKDGAGNTQPGPNGTDQRGVPYPKSGSTVSSCDIGAYHPIPTMYVSTAGDDGNLPCQAIGSACQHVGTALAFIQPSGTVNIAGETYCAQVVADHSMTVQAENAANPPVIDGGAGSGGCTPAGTTTPETPGRSAVMVGDVNNTPMTVTLQHLTIQHGDASNNPLDANRFPGAGGGVFVYPGATLDLTNSTVSENKGCTTNGCGGDGGYGGGVMSLGTLNVIDSSITGNTACSGTGCSVSSSGGGIYNQQDTGIAGSGTMTITNSTISDNTGCSATAPPGCAGGGIDDYGGTITMSDSTISGNVACAVNPCQAQGGGISAVADTATLIDSTVSDNTACSCPIGTGGGIDAGSFTMTLANSTIAGNVGCSNGAGCAGGGIEVTGSASLVNTTVSGNNACTGNACAGSMGGGLDNKGGTASLSNTILAGNGGSDPGGSGGPDCHGPLGDGKPDGATTIGDNIIGNSSGCSGLSSGVNGDQVGASATALNLGQLTNNGGATETMALGSKSVAIGAGSTVACAVAGVGDRDQRGDPRHSTARGTCDVGAYDTGQYVRLGLNAPGAVVAGQSFSLGVTATNATDLTTARGYGDTVSLSSSDYVASLPTYTFTAADAGTHAFNLTLPDPGNQTVKATDSSASLSRSLTVPVRIRISGGWNALDIPFQGSGITDDTTLAASLGASSVKAIATYANGAFSLYVPGYSADQPIAATQGIFVLASPSGTWLPAGTSYTSSPSDPLVAGWNFVAMPYPPGGLGTADIAAEATGCTVQEIALYTGSGYQVWTPSGSGAPFTVPTYRGVWIECSAGGGSITPSKPTR